MPEKIRVLLVEPLEKPRVLEIKHTLENLQKLAGGTLQAIYPWDDPVAIVCDDEGKLKGSMPNRALVDDEGEPYDIICGSFFLCGIGKDDFISISEKLAEKYAGVFRYPEMFIRTLDGHVAWLKMDSGEKPRVIT